MIKFVLFIVLCLSLIRISFAETITIICSYETYAASDGIHKVKDDFILTFIVDTENEKSYMLGNAGTEEILLVGSFDDWLSFIEITDTGNVMTTAIDSNKVSVHSRNTIMFNELIPSQYYGSCIFK